MSQLQFDYQGYIRPGMYPIPLMGHRILTSFRWKFDYEDYESEKDEGDELEEQDSDNESFHEVLENLALEEKRRIPVAAA